MLRRLLVAAWVLVGLAAGRAAEPPLSESEGPPPSAAADSDPPAKPTPTSPPTLPLHLPGYDLRVLDVKKSLLFNVSGSWVEVSVPIFFYRATTAHDEGIKMLRQVAEDLRQLLRKPAWTSAELGHVQLELDTGAALLGQP